MVHCVETQKCSNCTTLDLFGIHQQMLTDGTCGHSTSFTEMFLFALPVFEIESVLLRQLMMLFYVFLILMPWRAYAFHISSLWKFVADISLWDMLLPVKHCVLRNLPAKKKEVSPVVCNLLFNWQDKLCFPCSCLNFSHVCYRVSETSGFYMRQPTCCEHSLYYGKKAEISRLSVGETRYEKRSSILDCIQLNCSK